MTLLPADQRIAAELAELAARGDAKKFGDLLAALVDYPIERVLAVTSVLARNLAGALIVTHGPDATLKILEATRLDAAFHDQSGTDVP